MRPPATLPLPTLVLPLVLLVLVACHRAPPKAPPSPDCNGGNVKACDSEAEAQLFGHGTPRNPGRALTLFKRACDLQDVHGCGAEGLLLIAGVGGPNKLGPGMVLALEACRQADGASCLGLGRIFLEGREAKKNEGKAVDYLNQACGHGEPAGCTGAGKIHTQSTAIRDLPAAFGEFQRGCAGGDLEGCRRQAQALGCGRGTSMDTVAASRVLLAGCGKGDGSACRQAGELLAAEEPFAAMASRPVQMETELSAARHLLVTQQPDRAKSILLRVSQQGTSGRDRALFLEACLATDVGELPQAKAFLNMLGPGKSDPATQVLLKLLEEPRILAGEWPHALVRSWVKANKPDLRTSHLLPPEPTPELGECSHLERHPPRTVKVTSLSSFLRAYATRGHAGVDAELFNAAQRFANGGEPMGQWVALALLNSEELDQNQRAQGQASAEHALKGLAQRYPRDFYFSAFRLLGAQMADAPTKSERLNDLRKLMSSQTYQPPRGELFKAFESALAQDPGHANLAFSASVDVATSPGFTAYALVLARAAESGSPQDRENALAFLRFLGAKVASGNWMVDQAQGSYILRVAAGVSKLPADANLAAGIAARSRGFWSHGRVFPKLGSWPQSHFTGDWNRRSAENELAFYQQLREMGAE